MLGVALVVFTAGIGVAYAATVSQDVTLQVTAPGGGSTRNVTLKSGSSFDSLTVSGSTMAFTLSGSQSVSLTSSSLDFNNDQNVSSSCGSLTVTASQASTINIETGGNCSGGGGGGGGGYTPYTPPSPPATTTPEPEPSTTESTPSSSSSSSAEPTPSTIPPPSSVSTETTPTTPVQTVSFPIPSTELELGMENDEVTKLQELLASEPEIYPEGRVTGYFGELTRAAIRRFQERHGLPPVGRVGPLTLAKLNEVYGGGVSQTPPPTSASTPALSPTSLFEREMELGAEGDDVTQLQALLAGDSDLYPEGKITGYYGPLTQAAIRRFQERHGLPPVGRVGPLTLQKLTEEYGNVTLPPAPQVTEPTTQAPLPLPPVTYSQSGSVPIPTAELDLGMESIEVAKLQVLLAKDSSIYPGGSVTGYFGADTFEAVKRFQARYGLPTVGRVGSATLAKLKEVFDSE